MARKPNNKRVGYVDFFLEGIEKICRNISQKDIDQTIEILFKAWFDQNNIFLIGNGGSASATVHFAADLNNITTKIKSVHQIRALSLNDNIVRFSALINDQGWENVYVEQLKNYFKPGDIVFAISVHGGIGKDMASAWSQNLVKALEYAQDNGGKALGLAGFDGGIMKKKCDACIVIPYNTTPHVEGFYGVIHHLITERLTEKIKTTSEIISK